MMYRVVWFIFAPAITLLYGWVCTSFLFPFVFDVTKVLYEPIGYISGILFAGFFSILLVFGYRFVEVTFLKEVKPTNKQLKVSFVTGLIFGVFVNYATYSLIIEPKGLMECPAELGYKNNLMSEYVIDLKECSVN
ncbi:hypothetical protein MD535_12835 [Vibrio sp. ZSDZ65]|uniref:DUF1240 domain-containing protein n=1 Tax=Vibrio qingdaonensis TaxID=2829491 RepID=A0A9X3CPN1_9VIBR|nr:hypothetical protein [Vibrio qingdaonensis]MCW8346884.1 hypothetical protein [Vibrio qingdaonensis]